MKTLPWPCRPGHRGAPLRLRKRHYVVIRSILKETGECELGESKINTTTSQQNPDRQLTHRTELSNKCYYVQPIKQHFRQELDDSTISTSDDPEVYMLKPPNGWIYLRSIPVNTLVFSFSIVTAEALVEWENSNNNSYSVSLSLSFRLLIQRGHAFTFIFLNTNTNLNRTNDTTALEANQRFLLG